MSFLLIAGVRFYYDRCHSSQSLTVENKNAIQIGDGNIELVMDLEIEDSRRRCIGRSRR